MNYLQNPQKGVIIRPLAVSWVETRTEKEMILFSHLTEITHNIIRRPSQQPLLLLELQLLTTWYGG